MQVFFKGKLLVVLQVLALGLFPLLHIVLLGVADFLVVLFQILVPALLKFLGIGLVVAGKLVDGFLHLFLDVLVAVLDGLGERVFREKMGAQAGGVGGERKERQPGGEEAAVQQRVIAFHDNPPKVRL